MTGSRKLALWSLGRSRLQVPPYLPLQIQDFRKSSDPSASRVTFQARPLAQGVGGASGGRAGRR